MKTIFWKKSWYKSRRDYPVPKIPRFSTFIPFHLDSDDGMREHHRINQIEADSEYMRENICKPWNWHCIRRMCPNLIPKLEDCFGSCRWAKKTKTFFNRVSSFSMTSLNQSDDDFRDQLTSRMATHPMNTLDTMAASSQSLARAGLGADLKITVDAPSLLRQISKHSKWRF